MEPRIRPESMITSSTITIAYAFLFIYGVHLALVYFDVPILSLHELLWNVTVSCIPAVLLLDPARCRELQATATPSQVHAAKSDALRRLCGLGTKAMLQRVPSVGGDSVENNGTGWTSMASATPAPVTSEAPAGLGNWDNSCYQNSVLQAFAALDTLPTWLDSTRGQAEDDTPTTNRSLQETVVKLRDSTNNGTHLWTPAKLKSMSSWQQQDAQEYFSKIVDDLDREAAKTLKSETVAPGLESVLQPSDRDQRNRKEIQQEIAPRNPLEGLIAQRVACTSCGFSEGYSMIPFNCLTVPLGPAMEYDLSECLDEYTKLEAIEGVECRRCTLLRAEDKIRAMAASCHESEVSTVGASSKTMDLPPEVRAQIAQRLQAIRTALSEDDYSDQTLKTSCQIPTKSFVSSTKTREALVGRAPETLVVHINRSVFDEMTGTQRKNYAHVRYPLAFELTPWMVGMGNTTARYRLRAAITHYGRHENGHYICYRQHPTITQHPDNKTDLRWWRLSDEDVSSATEQDVLDQGGVFMLFYEREPELPPSKLSTSCIPNDVVASQPNSVAVDVGSTDREMTPPVAPESVPMLSSPSQSATSESDADVGNEGDIDSSVTAVRPESRAPHPPAMRTAPPTQVRHEFSMGRSLMSF